MKAVIGEPVTFQKLFLDADNNPVAVTTPTIEVYYWDTLGVKQTVLMLTPFPASSPVEVGRYAYTLDVPSDLTPDITLYAFMQGVDPLTLLDIVEERTVELFDPASATPPACPGLIARFF
jgi:hypothetical protein